MLLLLLLAVWTAGVATAALVLLTQQIRVGVIRSKYGYKTYRSQEPLKFWFSVVLLLAIILIFYSFALMMFLAALDVDR